MIELVEDFELVLTIIIIFIPMLIKHKLEKENQMSEFVNREDAIEAMTTARDTHSIEIDGEDHISYDMAQDFIREIPSSTELDDLFYELDKAYTCPSNLLDKAEALNDIMLAYNRFRDTQNRMSKGN